MSIFGIDVSEHQGSINWDKVKASGVKFAVIRCGYGSDIAAQDDKQFARNVSECERLGIPYGVYLYSYATNSNMAKSEAAHVLRLIKGHKLSYPVYYDLEQAGTESGASERAKIFGDIIEAAGFECGIYANEHWWNNYLKGLDRFTKWVAKYSDSKPNVSSYDIWQYSSTKKVDGISGNVDVNECYKDFSTKKEEEEVKTSVKGVVVFSNDPEQDLAIKLARKLGYAVLWSGSPCDYSVLPQENIWAIGGQRGSYTSYLLDSHFVSGANREETLKKVADVIASL